MWSFLYLAQVTWAQSEWKPGDMPAEPQPAAATVLPAPPSPWKECRHTLVGGIELMVLGTAVGLGTHRYAVRNNADISPAGGLLLQTANVGGWTMAGSGVALATVGALHGVGVINRRSGVQVAANPRGLTLAGRF